ncbi:hypothetical protein ACFSSA_00935 [Luteolibacter algae]|uniref:TPM domain-containing protein n=1 Tax=Luteolibacter algae TaxID=454151 RepID=A0ABW5D2F1_9BACT
MNKFFLILLVWTLFAVNSTAQRLPDSDIPKAPLTGLSDKFGVLRNSPSIAERIVQQLQELKIQHGFQLYLYMEPSLMGSSAIDLAAQLQEAWLPDGGGLVIVFESDTKKIGLGRQLETTEASLRSLESVPAYTQVEIITNSLMAANKEQNTEAYLELLVTDLCENFDQYFQRKKAPANSDRSLRLALITVGALSLLALAGIGLGWLMGKSDAKQAETRGFPQYDIPERLGAPYGGGCGGCHHFGPRNS